MRWDFAFLYNKDFWAEVDFLISCPGDLTRVSNFALVFTRLLTMVSRYNVDNSPFYVII